MMEQKNPSVDDILNELGFATESRRPAPAAKSAAADSAAQDLDALLRALEDGILTEPPRPEPPRPEPPRPEPEAAPGGTDAPPAEAVQGDAPENTPETGPETGPETSPGENPVTAPAAAAETATETATETAAETVPETVPEAGPEEEPSAPWMDIDIEAIRAEIDPQPSPGETPSGSPEEEQTPPETVGEEERQTAAPFLNRQIHTDPEKARELLKKKPHFTPEAVADFAPAFARECERLSRVPAGSLPGELKKVSRKNLILFFVLLLLFAGTLALGLFMGGTNPGGAAAVLLPTGYLLLGAGALGAAFPMVCGGLFSLIRLKPDRNTLPAAVYTLLMIQSLVLCLNPDWLRQDGVWPYLPVGILALAAAYLSRAFAFRAAYLEAKFICSDYDKFVPAVITDSRTANAFTEGLFDEYTDGFYIRRAQKLYGLLSNAFGPDESDASCRTYTAVGLCAAALAALFSQLFTQDIPRSLTVSAACLALFCPLACLFATAFPLKRVNAFLNRTGGMVASSEAARSLEDAGAMVVDAAELFPPACVTLNGIKTFQGMRIDEAILDAASTACAAGSILSGIFMKMIGGRKDLLREVKEMEIEDGKGISGWIGNRRVLIGSRKLLAGHGIRVPSEDYENRLCGKESDLVYLASSGELAAVFIVTLSPSQEADAAIKALFENDILLSVHTVDPMVTADRLAELFLSEPSCFKILPSSLHDSFAALRVPQPEPALLAGNGGFYPMAATAVAARRVRIMSTVSGVVRFASALLGATLLLVLCVLSALRQLPAPVLSAYLALWLLVDLLAQKCVRL